MSIYRPLKSIQEAQDEAIKTGHTLTPFERVDNGFQATCTKCQLTTWVGFKGMRYSLLANQCEGKPVY